MFNGIVETMGKITAIEDKNECKIIKIIPGMALPDLGINDSLAVNGVCLTVTRHADNLIDVTAVPETLRLTNIGQLVSGSEVNLERALKLDSRIGGHYVQGHVDGIGKIMDIRSEGDALIVKVSIPPSIAKYIVKKGYITIDGMSVTVIQAEPEWFAVTFIPHTQQITVVKNYRQGTIVNLEIDILGKYVEKLLGARQL